MQLLPHRPAVDERDRWPQHARASGAVHLGGPRRLGHVNSLTGDLAANEAFYVEALGMRISDRLGAAGVWFHTGLHPDYHTPQDRPERINYDKMEKIARMIHQMSWDIANANGRPKLAGRALKEM